MSPSSNKKKEKEAIHRETALVKVARKHGYNRRNEEESEEEEEAEKEEEEIEESIERRISGHKIVMIKNISPRYKTAYSDF